MNTQLMTAPGDAISTPAGDLSVNLIYIGHGAGNYVYRVTVTRPGFTPQPVGDDDRPFGHADQATAQQLAESYRDALVGYHTDAQTLRSEDVVAEGANANMDAARERYVAPKQAEQDRVADIVADIKARPRNLGAFVQGRPNQRRRTAPLTDTMRRALTRADHGVIRVQPGVAATTLKALAMSGLGETHSVAGGRPYEIAKLVLNQRGQRMAAEQQGVTA